MFEVMGIIVKLKFILKKLMESNDLTFAELSNATGVPRQTIHNWTCGVEPRSLKSVHSVASYFGLTMEEFCFGEARVIYHNACSVLKTEPSL